MQQNPYEKAGTGRQLVDIRSPQQVFNSIVNKNEFRFNPSYNILFPIELERDGKVFLTTGLLEKFTKFTIQRMGATIIDGYRKTEIMEGRISQLHDYQQKAESIKNIRRRRLEHEDIKISLQGILFADMAAEYVEQLYENDNTFFITSPEDILQFWQKIYPQNQRIKGKFDQDGILGVFVPDMIEIGFGTNGYLTIINVFDFTSEADPHHLDFKPDSFERLKKKAKGFFEEDAQLILVVPSDSPYRYYTENTLPKNTSILEIPMLRSQISALTNELTKELRF